MELSINLARLEAILREGCRKESEKEGSEEVALLKLRNCARGYGIAAKKRGTLHFKPDERLD